MLGAALFAATDRYLPLAVAMFVLFAVCLIWWTVDSIVATRRNRRWLVEPPPHRNRCHRHTRNN